MTAAEPGRPADRWHWAEFGWAVAWSAALAALTCVPYVMASIATPAGARFLGFVFNPDEPNVHLNWIHQAAGGAWLFRNQFTSEPHVGHFFNLFMLVTGRLARQLGLTPYQAWAVMRVLGALPLGVATYLAACGLTARRWVRRMATGLVTLSSGLGWLYLVHGAGGDPVDPANLLAVTLLLMAVVWGERAIRDRDPLSGAATVVVAALLRGYPRPDGVLLGLTLVAYWAIISLNDGRWEAPRSWPAWAALVVGTAPGLWAAPPSAGALAVLAAGWVGYLGVSLVADRSRLGWLRLVLLGAAAWATWTLLGGSLGLDPVDVEPGLVMPEAVTFLTLYLNPLFACSMALLVLAMVAGERALRAGDLVAAGAAGGAGLLLANIHTYDAVPLLLVLTSYAGVLTWQERRWPRLRWIGYAVIVGLIVPAVGYQWWLIASEPLYRAKAYTQTLTPSLPTMLVSYGWLGPLALYGAVARLRRGQNRFEVTWLLVHGLCLWLPAVLFPFQRKMIEGFHVVLALQATAGLIELARRAGAAMAWAGAGPRLREVGPVWAVRCDAACRRGGWSALFVVLGLLLLLPSNLLFVSSTLDATRTNNRAKVYQALMPPFYLPEAELQAIEWMGDNLPPDAVIGCLPMVGSYLPGLIGRTVYCGHWAETIHFADKLQAYSRFLKEPGLAAEKVAFLRQAGITHLYFGAYELEHTGGQLPQFPHLERVYPPAQEEALALPPAMVFRLRDDSELPPPPPIPSSVPSGPNQR